MKLLVEKIPARYTKQGTPIHSAHYDNGDLGFGEIPKNELAGEYNPKMNSFHFDSDIDGKFGNYPKSEIIEWV